MHNQTHRLIQHDQMIVLVEDIHWQVLRAPVHAIVIFGLQHQPVANDHFFSWLARLPLRLSAPLSPTQPAAPREIGKQRSGRSVKAKAMERLCHASRHRLFFLENFLFQAL